MNIKEYFNFKLYLQAIKNLKVIGIVSASCLGLFALLAPILTYLNKDYDDIIYIFAPLSYFEALYAVVYLIVPLMSIITFKFLSSRNGSDFYHSLPVKRGTMYISLLAAIITWAFVLIASFSIIHCTVHVLLPITVSINVMSILIFTSNIFICCTLVCAVFGLGCSLSGTTAANIFTSLSILIVPRMLLSIFCELLASKNDLVIADGMLWITRYKCNMVFGCLFEPYSDGYDYYGSLYSGPGDYMLSSLDYSTIYTLILAIIYIILGCIVFYKRPSEAAGKATFYPKLQFFLRMTIGYIISLFITSAVFLGLEDGIINDFNMKIFIVVFVVYLVGFIVMFIYELITSKSTKKALKSFITAPLIIIADIVTVIILCHIDNNINNYIPDADDISYVKFQFDYNSYDDALSSLISKNDNFSEVDNYYYIHSETIIQGITDLKITDKNIIEYASVLLELSAERYNDHDYWPEYNSSVILTIKDGLFETERCLYITNDEFETLVNLLINHDSIIDIYKSLPEEDNVFKIVSGAFITDKQNREIYNAFIKDLKNITPYEYHRSIYSSDIIYSFWIYYHKDSLVYRDTLPITYATPNAIALFVT